MSSEKGLLLGIDLADDYTQLCCCIPTGEMMSVSLLRDQSKYRIPTAVCACRGSEEWLVGEEAAMTAEGEAFTHVHNLVSKAANDIAVDVFGKTYTVDLVLERFLGKLLPQLKIKAGISNIDMIVVTVKSLGETLENNIRTALRFLGYGDDKVKILTHLQSFMYYVVSQNRDIWINDVGLFDFESDEFVFYRLSFGRRNTPLTVVAEKNSLAGSINYDMLTSGDTERLLFAFENVVSLMLHKQQISALYFTGCGFETGWADEVLKRLSSGRRIFRGQNLYVKGACYAAKLLTGQNAEEYVFVNDEVLRSSIAIRVYKDGGYTEYELAHIGQPCEKAGADIDVIMDGTNELDFIVHNVLKKDFICAIMTLDTLELRKDRTVRLNVRLSFPKRDTCVITIRDIGFGQIVRTNHKIWEQVLKI